MASTILTFAGLAVMLASFKAAFPGRLGILAAGNVLVAAGDILDRFWIGTAINGTCALICLWMWWRKRKDRKRTLDSLGAKSRARRDALVAKVRERAVPRPALKPAPDGVS